MENVDKVRVLLSARAISPNIRDANETPGTPLDLALRNRNVEIASELISNRKVRSNPAQRALLKRMGKKS